MTGPVLSILLGGAAIFGLIVGSRWLEARAWRQSLTALSLRFPRGLKADEISAWLGILGSLRVVVALEVVATRQEVKHYLLVPKARQADLISGTRAVLPGLRIEEAPTYTEQRRQRWRVATEFKITHLSRQLATGRADSAVAAFLGSLGQLGTNETACAQWLLEGIRTPRPRAANDRARHLARDERIKHSGPMLHAVGRIAVSAAPGRAGALLGRIAGTVRLLDAPGAAVVRRRVPSAMAIRRVQSLAQPVTAWPVIVNAAEAVGLIGVPLGQNLTVPGLVLGRSRQLPPGQMASRNGTVLATSNYPGRATQQLVLRTKDRLHHLYAVGPTGVGKSNLLAQIAVQDAAAGYGLCLIDPKSDLAETVLAQLPDEAADRVILMDPSRTDRPVGFNPLSVSGNSEHSRELAADQVLHVFHDIYRSYWGPRTDDVLRAALMTLVSVRAPNGQAFTICEIPELLTRPALRRYVANQPDLPDVLKTYWTWFDGMSDGEQLQHIGPVMNKLRAFTMRTSTRLMLGQSAGVDLAEVIRRRLVLLVSLAKGKLGTETATLTGSLLVAAFWQATLGRANVAPGWRRPFFLILDEFQDLVRLSDSLPDLLSQARGFGIGAVLANQYLAQLPESARAAVLGTVRSQVAFQVEHDDARLLEKRFAPSLTAADLMGLERYEIALRPFVDGQTMTPVTGLTLPLGDPVREAEELAKASLDRWGRARVEVEDELRARAEAGEGRQARPGRSYRRRTT